MSDSPKNTVSSNDQFSPKETALVGLSVAIAAGCRPCSQAYVKKARISGACERGIRLAIETGLNARRLALVEIENWGSSLQEAIPELDDSFRSEKASLVRAFQLGGAIVQKNPTAIEAYSQDESQKRVHAVLTISQTVSDRAAQEALATVQTIIGQTPSKIPNCCEESTEKPVTACACQSS